MKTLISIGQVKRDISEIVNRVAFGGERIILTSRGKPKAALVSIEDYQKLQGLNTSEGTRMRSWKEKTLSLANQILEKRGGKMVDLDEIILADKFERDQRDEHISYSS